MSDVNTGIAEVSDTIETIVAAELQSVLTAEAVIPGTILDFSSRSVPGMNTIKYPKFSNFVVNTKLPDTPVDAQSNSLSSDSLVLDQHKVIQFLVEDIADLQSKVNFVQGYIQQAGKDLAAEMDQKLIDDMEAGVSASSPDHKRAYAAGSALADADLLQAIELLSIQKINRKEGLFLLVSPESEVDLLGVTAYISVADFGSADPIVNGQIGRVRGFSVIMSPAAEQLKTLAYHKSTHVFGRQMAPRYQTQYVVSDLATRHSIDHLYGSKSLQSGKRTVLLGTA